MTEVVVQKLGTTLNSLRKLSGDIVRNVRQSVLEETFNLRADIKQSMLQTPKTGRKYKRKFYTHIASFPGNPPAVDTGNLISSIVRRIDDSKNKMSVEVGATKKVFYAKYLESGNKKGNKMKARPFMMPAIERMVPKLKQNIIHKVIDAVNNL